MYPATNSHGGMGNFIAWDATTGKIVWSIPEQFSAWGGALATAGDVVFYGTLEGYLKAVDAQTGKELYKFKTPSGIIGNVDDLHAWRQAVRRRPVGCRRLGGHRPRGRPAHSGERGRLARRGRPGPCAGRRGNAGRTAGLGAVGGYAALANFTTLGGTLTVFAAAGLIRAELIRTNDLNGGPARLVPAGPLFCQSPNL